MLIQSAFSFSYYHDEAKIHYKAILRVNMAMNYCGMWFVRRLESVVKLLKNDMVIINHHPLLTTFNTIDNQY